MKHAWRHSQPAATALGGSILLCLLISPARARLAGAHGLGYFDFNVYRGAANAVLHGLPLYDTRIAHSNFTYPPLSAILLLPLALVGIQLGEALFTAVSIAALVALMWFALALEPVRTWLRVQERASLALLAAAAGLWLEPVFTTLGYGQVDLIIALLVVYDLSRSDDARLTGALIGLAAGLKLTPMIFVAYLALAGRQWPALRAVACFAATVVVGFVLLPGSASRYWGGLFLDSSRAGRVQNSANQSLQGAAARLLHTSHVELWWLCAALLVGAVGIALAALASRHGNEAIGFSLCAVTGLLVSPISWTHHWVLIAPALLLLGVTAWRRRSLPALFATAAVAAIGYSHVTWTVNPKDELHLGPFGLIYADAYVLAGIAALAAALWATRRRGGLAVYR